MKVLFLFIKRKISVLLFLLLILAPLSSYGQEKRLIPISFKSCDPKENKDYSAKNLWDNNTDPKHKWHCFHAGYTTSQIHWVIMDLGDVYPITRIVVQHEGDETGQFYLLTEDYKLFGSDISINGPWFMVREVKENRQKINDIELPGIKVRYLGLEVTDPQLGSGPNQKQDDWAVRISELYIYTEPVQNPTYVAVPSSLPSPFDLPPPLPTPTPNPLQPAQDSTPPFPDNVIESINKQASAKSGKKLLYFYNSTVVKCKNLETYLSSPKVMAVLKTYYFEPVRTGANDPRLTQYSIYIVPSLIILDSKGIILKRTSAVTTEEELIKFLE
jgi:hypothetical protein